MMLNHIHEIVQCMYHSYVILLSHLELKTRLHKDKDEIQTKILIMY